MSEKRAYQKKIGEIVTKLRIEKNMTQTELAKKVGTSQSAIHRIEKGDQNTSLEMVKKLSNCLGGHILSINDSSSQNFCIHGGKELHGEITVNTSKNAAVGLICAALLNSGKTTLKHVARIEEVFRLVEVLESIGVKCRWVNNKKDLEITPPNELKIKNLDIEAAKKTRSIIMFMGPLLHRFKKFQLPYAGGCSLGVRTIEPHIRALSAFGLKLNSKPTKGFYDISVEKEIINKDRKIILTERGDTVTENAIMAAALCPKKTTIVGASSNYMVQDVCYFLQDLGVKIEGIGTTTLVVEGHKGLFNKNISYSPSEDPIEAMSLIAVGLVTKSEITIRRAPIEFLEIELEILKTMNAKIEISNEYHSWNKRTRLVDLKIKKSTLRAPIDKIHPMPFPGLNIDNLLPQRVEL